MGETEQHTLTSDKPEVVEGKGIGTRRVIPSGALGKLPVAASMLRLEG